MAEYVPNPRISYKCPYCNEPARLADIDTVIDGHKNVCHLACFDKEVAYLITPLVPIED
jgi:hypothetical protein